MATPLGLDGSATVALPARGDDAYDFEELVAELFSRERQARYLHRIEVERSVRS